MSRWLFAVCCALCLAAFGVVSPSRSSSAHMLGGVCESDSECQLGLQCSFVSGVLDGQCSASCNSTGSCQERFGARALCLGADVCTRTCQGDEHCPAGTACNLYGWCEAQR